MNNNNNNRFLLSAISLWISNFLLVTVGVILMPSLVWAVAWAVGCLAMHFVLLGVIAYYDLQATLAADAIAFNKMLNQRRELR